MRFIALYTPEKLEPPTPEMFAAMGAFIQEATAAGVLLATEGFGPSSPSDCRVRRSKGKVTITDGPFAESKEFLAGWWIVDVASKQEAYDIAARASMAPGKGGKPLHLPIEVREVGAPPEV